MIAAQMSEWLDYHGTMFPAFLSWLDSQESPDRIVTAWARVLADVELHEAREATDAIVGGDVDRPFHEDLPAAIRKRAMSRRSHREPAPESTTASRSCCYCRGTGMASIWHPLVVKCFRAGVTSARNPRTGETFHAVDSRGSWKDLPTAVPCACTQGERFASQMRKTHDGLAKRDVIRLFGHGDYVPKLTSCGDTLATLPDDWQAEQSRRDRDGAPGVVERAF